MAMPEEVRKQEIFAAAERLFGESGYEKTTMADIAQAVGMSKKTLYVLFADKQALLTSLVVSSYIWPEAEQVSAAFTPRENLRARLRVVAGHVLSTRHLRLCRLAISEGRSIEGLARTFYDLGIAKSRQTLIEAIAEIPAAQRRLALDAATQADMLWGAAIGGALIDGLLFGTQPPMDQVHAAIDAAVEALLQA